jgi:hypothetical protein
MNTTHPRATTIVWGAILLVVAALAVAATTVGFDFAGPATFLWLVVGIGGVIILAAITAGVIHAVRGSAHSAVDSPAAADAPEPEHQPVD